MQYHINLSTLYLQISLFMIIGDLKMNELINWTFHPGCRRRLYYPIFFIFIMILLKKTINIIVIDIIEMYDCRMHINIFYTLILFFSSFHKSVSHQHDKEWTRFLFLIRLDLEKINIILRNFLAKLCCCWGGYFTRANSSHGNR